ncbi:hypothetical protein DRE_04293 [Drechslerella stenobrocha 248]|uniref:Transcription factor TFIIIC triple barrel domain-containing protein n=1 Tax=Drechslerella stenobrocha 248 TaxID=1043628 RepID=W7IBX3_9PEZI|nr:hypothetical protein DRE_04293 [Drechslerella stenobrocha 248]
MPPTAPAEPVFADGEETESFYVVLDLSGDDFATYGRYRDGTRVRPRLDDYGDGDQPSDDDDPPPPSDDDPVDDDDDGDGDEEGDEDPSRERPSGEDDEDDEDTSRSDISRSAASTPTPHARELAFQLLDLDTYNPLVNYEGKVYSCAWATTIGTELIFEPPYSTSYGGHPQHAAAREDEEEEEEEEEKGRKLRQHPEARLLGTAVHRLEGWPGKLRPRGRDKQEVSTKARVFAERLDAVLDHRIVEMVQRGEDVDMVTMRKFSEGQQARDALNLAA